ncbi:MAG TPA: thiamine phosphate synthase [Terriglobales bacterium]|nr:thiamine phosphate synthase [Terriglobales bacterium]
MLLYYITDRGQLPGDDAARRRLLIEHIGAAAQAGVDYIQLREKDLAGRELEQLARAAAIAIRGRGTKLLTNSRVDIAIAVGAHGVHLRADDISAVEAREIFAKSGAPAPIIGVSCHTIEEVKTAARQRADFAVFGPVFGKDHAAGVGIALLREACRAAGETKVIALGGVTAQNAAECMAAGAAGVAGIRLFQNGDVTHTVPGLRPQT